ncbi:MAG: SDR family oxidoreductase [Pseudomonadota bacterium]
MDVKGKKAVIFGGTSGIGLAAAKQLVAKGADVIAISRNPDTAGPAPDGVTYKACDVRDRDALTATLEECAPYDILVSAATGGDRAIGPFMTMDMDGYAASFDKLWGYANVVRYGAGHLPDTGCVVLVSGAPARKCKPGQIALTSVGGAVEAFARGVAPELAPKRASSAPRAT